MTLNKGDLLQNGRYCIDQYIDSGGFGSVYKAVDTQVFDSIVAIKTNAPQLPAARTPSEADRQREFLEQAHRRFKTEAQLLNMLRHPNLPRVTDYFDEPGVGQFMVMDFIQGISLGTLLEKHGGPLPEAEALYYIREIGDALNYLHTRPQPIVHRDVKPDNIILKSDDGRVFLVDFGVAKSYFPDRSISIELRGVTRGYSPPEQYTPQTPTTPRSDIYALGATLYTLLTFSGRWDDGLPDANARIADPDATPPPHVLNPAVSRATSDAVMMALNLAMRDRPESIARFLAMLPDLPYDPPPRPIQTEPHAAISTDEKTYLRQSEEAPPEEVALPGEEEPGPLVVHEIIDSSPVVDDPSPAKPPEAQPPIIEAGEQEPAPRNRLWLALPIISILLLSTGLWLIISSLSGNTDLPPTPTATRLVENVVTATAEAVVELVPTEMTNAAPTTPPPDPTDPPAPTENALDIDPDPTDTEEPSPTPTPPTPTHTPIPALPTPEINQSGEISVAAISNVYTRTGPGMVYDILGSLSAGQVVTAIGRDATADWFLVRPEQGEPRWVAAAFVRVTSGAWGDVRPAMTIPPTPTAPPTETPPPVVTNTPNSPQPPEPEPTSTRPPPQD